MPLAYVTPEEAFEIRIQCTEEEIQRHCDAAPENDRRDFDDRGGLQVPVYHVYKGTNYPDALTYWYTFDECEEEDNEFDIRCLPYFVGYHDHDFLLQYALDNKQAHIKSNRLVINETEDA